jgi:ubiquinone biosynthesis protein
MVVVEGVARQLDPEHSIWDAARPVVEQWMIDAIGPQARIREAAEGMSSIGRAITALPEVLRNAEQIAAMLSQGGIRLHPESAQAIAAAQANRTSHVRIAVWIGALALAALAIAQF